jgi:hypothetical protein
MDIKHQALSVVILAYSSLLSGGLASKLNEYKDMFKVQLVNSDTADVAEILRVESPAVIIVDISDVRICEKWPVSNLLHSAPRAKLIQLDLSSDHIQVFSSAEMQVTGAGDLVSIIQNFSAVDGLI